MSCSQGREYVSSTVGCSICVAGRYQDIDGALQASTAAPIQCVACPIGRYLPDPGSNDVNHNNKDDCLFCPQGYEYVSSTSACMICSAGRYQNEDVSVELQCKGCPPGKFNGDNREEFVVHNNANDCKICSIGKTSRANASECSRVLSQQLPIPTNITLLRINQTTLSVTWSLAKPTHNEVQASTQEMQLSSDRLFLDTTQILTRINIDMKVRRLISPQLTTEVWKQVYYARVRGVLLQADQGGWSETTEKWLVGSDCSDLSYLNDTVSMAPDAWVCDLCPLGGYCGGSVRREDVIPKFGWSRCPAASIVPFQSCPFPAACLGGPNSALLGKFTEEGVDDPANCNNQELCVIGCNTAYRNHSRLCAACEENYSHGDLSGRCDLCPEDGRNKVIAILGVFGKKGEERSLGCYLFSTVFEMYRYS